MSNEEKAYLGKAKTWTLVSAILATIMTVTSMFALLGLVGSQKIINSGNTQGLPQESIDVLRDQITPLSIGIIAGQFLIFLVTAILFYIYNSRLKNNVVVNKIPYFIYLVPYVYGLISSIINGIQTHFSTFGIVSNILFSIPAVLAIMYLFKVEPENG